MKILNQIALIGLISAFSANASQLFDNVLKPSENASSLATLSETQNLTDMRSSTKHSRHRQNATKRVGTEWTISEDMTLLMEYNTYGKDWKIIQHFLPNKSLSAIKNRLRIVKKKYDKKPTINALPRPDFSGLNLTYSESDQNERLFAPLLPANFVSVEDIGPLPFEF